jgi:hypothetical protein
VLKSGKDFKKNQIGLMAGTMQLIATKLKTHR